MVGDYFGSKRRECHDNVLLTSMLCMHTTYVMYLLNCVCVIILWLNVISGDVTKIILFLCCASIVNNQLLLKSDWYIEEWGTPQNVTL